LANIIKIKWISQDFFAMLRLRFTKGKNNRQFVAAALGALFQHALDYPLAKTTMHCLSKNNLQSTSIFCGLSSGYKCQAY
jgi:hypothetical protein